MAEEAAGKPGEVSSGEDSSADEQVVEWIFYRERPEWKDIKPHPQDDGPFPVVQIAYSEKFCDVYGYFRAILSRDERSERAFGLTTDAIFLNSANYTVWQFRRILLKELKKDLNKELEYITDVIEEHPKNYQVWHHRRVLVDWMRGNAAVERQFTADILKSDAKNYHAWQHRQWILSEFNAWDGELDYIDVLLEQDLRNNSAWNQRYYVIGSTTRYTRDVIDKEIEYTLKKIDIAPHNESAWNYLRGVLQDSLLNSVVETFCENMYTVETIRSPHLLAFFIDLYDEKMEKLGAGKQRDDLLQKSLQMCTELSDVHDTIRREYWRYISRSLASRYGQTVDGTTPTSLPTSASIPTPGPQGATIVS